MANARTRARVRNIQAQPTLRQKKKPTTSKSNRAHCVDVGDLVMFHSPNNHLSGIIGEVTHILSTSEVVVRGIAPMDDDYDAQSWVVRTRKPSGKNTRGYDRENFTFWIKKVLVRANPKPPTPPRPKKQPVVKQVDHKGLVEILASTEPLPKGHHVVLTAPAKKVAAKKAAKKATPRKRS